MSSKSGFSRRWQRVRWTPGRVPLRIKLITAVLALVAIALVVISIVGISVLRGSLLGGVDASLEDLSVLGSYHNMVQHYLFNQTIQESPGGQVWLGYLGPDGQLQPVLEPVTVRLGAQPTVAAPRLPSADWLEVHNGQPLTVPALSGGRQWRVVAYNQTFINPGGGTVTGTLLLAADVTSVYNTVGTLARIDLIVSVIVIVALAVVGIAIVRTSLRPLTDIERTAEAIAAGDLSRRVPDRDPRTEVGRLGRSLNTMLAQIEAAFHAREHSESAARRSEERMRRFVADASHELRTPLTAIRGYAEYYRQRGGVGTGRAGNGGRHRDAAAAGAAPAGAAPAGTAPAGTELSVAGTGGLTEPDMDRIMQRVEQESSRMGLLVEDMLLLARLDQQRPIERRPVDLLTLAADAVQDARMIASSRAIELTVGRSAAFIVLGDEARLRQVIANLMSNALSHTPDGTPIEVRILAHGPDGGLPVPSVTLEVADSGPGLTREQADRVFERFYRADQARGRKAGGAGLGLAIVAALVTAHGGTTGVDTSPGDGATFWITLPLAAEAA
ncbi:MAG TPA: HAMP domain-containing sensor histidine kinase [Streptosporangiaceae bacterium]|nr:HAMP domain-containing sensor histidine kinase [Streptosporangiaceae bacterium]